MRRGYAVGEGRPVETPSPSPPDLEACFRHLPHVVVLLGPDGEVLAANEAAQRLAREVLARPLEVGRRLADQLPAEERRGWEDALAALRSGGDGVLGERPIEYAGRTAWFDVRLAPMNVEGEKNGGTILTLASADDRRQAHEALTHSERRFRLLLQHAADGVTVIGTDGSVLYISPAVERIFGRSPEDMVGTDGFSYIHPEDLPLAEELFRSSLEDPGRTHRAAFRMSRKDGTWAHMELVTSAFVEDPAIQGIVVNARDVTEQRDLEARLRFADRMASLGTLAAGVAHEINNPLSFVMGNLEILAREPCSREVRERLAQVRDGVDRVRHIVRDLKTFSRGEVTEPGSAAAGLEPVLESALTLAANEIRHRARLVRRYDAAPRVQGDPARLAQAFLALLINAAQAIPEGAAQENEITVTLREEGGRALAEIADTGAGIEPDVLPRIFDPFFTTKPVGVGTGLGLSISHGILTAAGGEVQVESRPGAGTRVRVSLPLAAPEPSPGEPGPDGPVSVTRSARILIVDDEVPAARTLELLLCDCHRVDTVTSGRAALERLVQDPDYDVVLCDLMMPDVSGPDLHAALTQQAPHYLLRLVFVTGGAFTSRARAFVESVENEVLEKPYTLDEVLAAVARVLG